jgi:hypothetical protein
MFDRFGGKTAGVTVAALLAALGVGGVAAAQNGSTSQQAPASSHSSAARTSAASEVPGQESNAPENSAADPDNVQQGDTAGAVAKLAAAPDVPAAGDTPDTGSAAEAPRSEVPGDDGPGGHADEPGNPAADHQATGVE